MRKSILQIVAVAVLSTMFASGAGAVCGLHARVTPQIIPQQTTARCHPSKSSDPGPSHPQSGDYRCCAIGHASALLTQLISPRPVLQTQDRADAKPLLVAPRNGEPAAPIVPSGGPPGVVALRI